MTRFKPIRMLFLGGTAVLILALSPILSSSTSAQVSGCRSDPLVTLSNQTQIRLYEDIGDIASNVTSITYELHVPAGITVTSIVYTGDVPASKQSITVIADETTHTYDAYTTVATVNFRTRVMAYMSANDLWSTGTGGRSFETLHSYLLWW